MEGDYTPDKIEDKWRHKWQENQTYEYKEDEDKEVFSIDTPPPTVSGSLHFGHTYGNTLTDFQARFQRMQGKDVFFPFGYDNNGIASERLTEKELDIRHQDFSRRDFQDKVREVCKEYEQDFQDIMRKFAFSMDWNNTYKTIEPRVQKTSQLSFIDLYEKGMEYREKGPAIWCPECETAISQVEMEGLDEESHFNDIEFDLATGHGAIVISTTRPELLPSCVAIFVHPEDESNNHLAGEKAEVPLFGHEVPIIEDDRVDRETGTGVVMSCTFGDETDIEWYKAHDLDLRIAIDESGQMTDKAGEYEGLSTEEARSEIVDDLDEEGKLIDRRAINHTIKVHERCDTGIEFLVKEQWYVELLENKDKYLEAGEQLDWHPEKMLTRYEHWIEGLEWDWCISRQRDSGIPFPVWYCEDCGEEIIADKTELPIDPIEDEPPVNECPECGSTGFKAEEDVFDTWATSSLTPLINAGWHWNEEEEEYQMERDELYPINLRPQGHDIISFWLFHTVVKCLEHTGEVPFNEVMINGHILDENREKMSKSRGNVVLPQNVVKDYPVDAARYWSAGAKVGDDMAFSEKDLVAGEKLLRKMWNASKLVDNLASMDHADLELEDLDPVDRWIIAELDETVEEVTEHFEEYEFSKARDKIRDLFWNTFCDDYLEIAKQKLDDEENRSTAYALRTAHKTFLKLFAPITPHLTEEIWQEMYGSESIHNSEWPETRGIDMETQKGENAMKVISALRKYKTGNQMSLNEEIEHIQVYGDIEGFEDAIEGVMHIGELELLDDEPETEKKIIRISLDYSEAGPKYGDKVSKIEEALENNEYSIDTGKLVVADEHLAPEMYEVEEDREYTGRGEMIEEDDLLVVVKPAE